MDTMTMPEACALESLTTIARELSAYGGRLGSWAYSSERVDQWDAEAMRGRCKALALLVAHDVELAERTRVALTWACQGDAYAVKELAGRFRNACARVRLAAAVRRHPRADRFGTLLSCIDSGRLSMAQLELAKKLEAEVTS